MTHQKDQVLDLHSNEIASTRLPLTSRRDALWRSARVSLGVGVLGLLLFVALAGAVNARLLAGLDLNATIALQPYTRPLLDQVAVAVEFLLSAELCGVYALVFAAILWRRGAGLWSVLPLGFVGPVLIEAGLKHLLHQPLVPIAYYRGTSLPLLDVPTPGSFPSGHVVRAAWFAVFLGTAFRPARRWTRWLGWGALVFLVVFIAASRVYLGVHWLSDVLGGALFGAALAWPVARIGARRLVRSATTRSRMASSRERVTGSS